MTVFRWTAFSLLIGLTVSTNTDVDAGTESKPTSPVGSQSQFFGPFGFPTPLAYMGLGALGANALGAGGAFGGGGAPFGGGVPVQGAGAGIPPAIPGSNMMMGQPPMMQPPMMQGQPPGMMMQPMQGFQRPLNMMEMPGQQGMAFPPIMPQGLAMMQNMPGMGAPGLPMGMPPMQPGMTNPNLHSLLNVDAQAQTQTGAEAQSQFTPFGAGAMYGAAMMSPYMMYSMMPWMMMGGMY